MQRGQVGWGCRATVVLDGVLRLVRLQRAAVPAEVDEGRVARDAGEIGGVGGAQPVVLRVWGRRRRRWGVLLWLLVLMVMLESACCCRHRRRHERAHVRGQRGRAHEGRGVLVDDARETRPLSQHWRPVEGSVSAAQMVFTLVILVAFLVPVLVVRGCGRLVGWW